MIKKKIMNEWLWMGRKQADIFMRDNVGFIESLITCDIPIKLMIYCYRSLLYRKKIKEIEMLPESQKETLWSQTKEFANGRLDIEQSTNLARALYTLEYILNSK